MANKGKQESVIKDNNVIKYLTVKEVAEQLGCSNSFVYKLFSTGKLNGIQLSPKFIRFKQDDIDKLLKGKS